MYEDDWVFFSDFEDLSDIEPMVVNDPEVIFHDSMIELAQDMQLGFYIVDVSGPQTKEEAIGLYKSRFERSKVRPPKVKPNNELANLGPNDANDQPKGRRGRREQPDDLPQGWSFKQNVRKHGKSKGIIDKTYYSPTGKKFRSLRTAQEYIKRQNGPN